MYKAVSLASLVRQIPHFANGKDMSTCSLYSSSGLSKNWGDENSNFQPEIRESLQPRKRVKSLSRPYIVNLVLA
jgi:hypothetical protein